MEPSASPAPSAEPTVTVTEYHVNCGGAEYNEFEADQGDESPYHDTYNTYSTGYTISNTTHQTLFQTERYASQMTWNFPVPPGEYSVTLCFAEIYNGTMSIGARIFDVAIEGELVLENFDIYAIVGALTAHTETFTVTVLDGNLTIEFIKVRICIRCGCLAAPLFSSQKTVLLYLFRGWRILR